MPKTMLRLLQIIALIFLLAACNDKRALVVGKIQQASKLATTEFTVDKIVHGTKEKKLMWLVSLNETHFLAYSQAKIKAGVDLSKLTYDDIVIRGSRIEITLPPVEVINFSYPPKSFKLDEEISETRKFLNTISIEDQEVFFRDAELDIRNNLQYMGLVETTQKNTRTLLTTLLKSLNYNEVYISFKSNDLLIDKVDLTPPAK